MFIHKNNVPTISYYIISDQYSALASGICVHVYQANALVSFFLWNNRWYDFD